MCPMITTLHVLDQMNGCYVATVLGIRTVCITITGMQEFPAIVVTFRKRWCFFRAELVVRAMTACRKTYPDVYPMKLFITTASFWINLQESLAEKSVNFVINATPQVKGHQYSHSDHLYEIPPVAN